MTKRRWHLTREEKAEICRLTRLGVRQSVIARSLGIGPDTIGIWQVRMGLPTRLRWPEKRILRLFEKGWGGYRIAKHLNVPVNQVYAIAHKNNFRRKDGVGYPEPHGDVAGFIKALKNREGYLNALAKRFGVGFCKANRLAHEILGTYRFRPGPSKPPLSSVFPQRHYPQRKAHG